MRRVVAAAVVATLAVPAASHARVPDRVVSSAFGGCLVDGVVEGERWTVEFGGLAYLPTSQGMTCLIKDGGATKASIRLVGLGNGVFAQTPALFQFDVPGADRLDICVSLDGPPGGYSCRPLGSVV